MNFKKASRHELIAEIEFLEDYISILERKLEERRKAKFDETIQDKNSCTKTTLKSKKGKLIKVDFSKSF